MLHQLPRVHVGEHRLDRHARHEYAGVERPQVDQRLPQLHRLRHRLSGQLVQPPPAGERQGDDYARFVRHEPNGLVRNVRTIRRPRRGNVGAGARTQLLDAQPQRRGGERRHALSSAPALSPRRRRRIHRQTLRLALRRRPAGRTRIRQSRQHAPRSRRNLQRRLRLAYPRGDLALADAPGTQRRQPHIHPRRALPPQHKHAVLRAHPQPLPVPARLE